MPETFRVGMAEMRAAGPPDKLAVYGIGSCVVMVFYDPEAKVGGLAHTMLPTAAAQAGGEEQPGKFCDTAVGAMLQAMQALGAKPQRCTVRLVGGANMFSFTGREHGPPTLGERNLLTARETLRSYNLLLSGEESGGDKGRSLELDPADGSLMIWSAFQNVRWL